MSHFISLAKLKKGPGAQRQGKEGEKKVKASSGDEEET